MVWKMWSDALLASVDQDSGWEGNSLLPADLTGAAWEKLMRWKAKTLFSSAAAEGHRPIQQHSKDRIIDKQPFYYHKNNK